MSKKLPLKLVILGDSGVGKTSLINRYTKNIFKTNYAKMGFDIFTKKLLFGKDKIPTTLVIWDIRGKVREYLHLYLSGADGAIIIYDITRRTTFNNLSNLINYILKYAGDIPYLLVGNKLDLASERKITLDEVISFSKTKNNAEVLETSAMTGENIDLMFYKISEKMLLKKETN